MAPKPSIVRRHYKIVKDCNEKEINATCAYCGKFYIFNISRMKGHIIQCSKLTKEQKDNIRKQLYSEENQKESCKGYLTSMIQNTAAANRESLYEDPVPGTSKCAEAGSVRSRSPISQTQKYKATSATTSWRPISRGESEASVLLGLRSGSSQDTREDDMSRPSSCDSSSGQLPKLFADIATKQEQFKVELSQAMFATGSPMRMVENPYWVRFFKRWVPSVRMPTRKSVANKYLDLEYSRVRSLVLTGITEAEVGFVTWDSWSNLRLESIVNIIITCPHPLLFKSIATGILSHTGQFMAQEIDLVFQEIGASKILGGVCDSASNMVLTRELLSTKYEHMVFFPCIIHVANLLMEDIAQQQLINHVITKCLGVVGEINKSTLLRSWLANIQKAKGVTASLRAPGKTRFASHSMLLQSIEKNKSCLKQLAIEEPPEENPNLKMNEETITVLLSETFWKQVHSVKEVMIIFEVQIAILESDNSNLAVACDAFKKIEMAIDNFCLTTNISEPEKVEMKKCVKFREDMALTDAHFAAHLLHPKLKGSCLSGDEIVKAFSYIEKIGKHFEMSTEDIAQAMEDLALYQAGEGTWSRDYIRTASQRVQPLTFWKGLGSFTKLSLIARKIFQIPPSSASCERSFSTNSIVHSIKRNRLTILRSMKASYVKHNLKLLQSGLHNMKLTDIYQDCDAAYTNYSPSVVTRKAPVSATQFPRHPANRGRGRGRGRGRPSLKRLYASNPTLKKKNFEDTETEDEPSSTSNSLEENEIIISDSDDDEQEGETEDIGDKDNTPLQQDQVSSESNVDGPDADGQQQVAGLAGQSISTPDNLFYLTDDVLIVGAEETFEEHEEEPKEIHIEDESNID